MQAVDGYSIEIIGIPSAVLMEKAALAVASTVKEHCNDKKKERILAVCGTGNNGGDGIATARILKEWGLDASVLLLGKEEKATIETKRQLMIAKNTGVIIKNETELGEYTIIVDAIFGIGLSRIIEGIYYEMIQKINETDAFICAVDIPSGIHTDTGKVMGIAVNAHVTVTFGFQKLGMVLYPGCEYANKVIVADIGFPKKAMETVKPYCFAFEKEDKKCLPRRQNDSNKGSYGRVLIIGGSANMCGACYLSAKAAYRTGAGLVKIMTEDANRVILQTNLPEALLFTYNKEKLISSDQKQLKEMLKKEIDWATVIVIGPGLSTNKHGELLLDFVMEYAKVPTIIDADAINLLANKKVWDWDKKEKSIILTPHLKEMSRLTSDSIDKIKEDLVSYGMKYAKEKEIYLVLKDARTVITDGTIAYLNCSGNNGMSTGGAGDVLTGIIAGLLAQHTSIIEACGLGAYLHGLAADREVLDGNTYSLIASDMIEGLKKELTE